MRHLELLAGIRGPEPRRDVAEKIDDDNKGCWRAAAEDRAAGNMGSISVG